MSACVSMCVFKTWASFLTSMSLVIFCLLFSFVDYIKNNVTIAREEWGGDSGERGL